MKSKNDGRTLASGNINSNVIIWQIEKDFVYTLGHKDYINFITYSPDGSRVKKFDVSRNLYVKRQDKTDLK